MGVVFEKIRQAAATIRAEAEYIAEQDSFDVHDDATEDLRAAILAIADVFVRRELIRRGEG